MSRARVRRDTMTLWAGALLLTLVVGYTWSALAATTTRGILGDLTIYREAIAYQAAGGHLYDYVYEHPTVHGLGFTYPPFAALVLRPLTWIPEGVVGVVWVASNFAMLIWLVCWAARSAVRQERTWLGRAPTPRRTAAAASALAALAILTFPFLHQLGVGQVSLLLIACCVVDMTVVPPRWRGILTGLAGAIKLTPLVFLLLLVFSRQWAAALRTATAFLAATALAWVLWSADSIDYWGTRLWQTGRVGRLDSVINKSILGSLARWDVPGSTLWWVVLGTAMATVALWRALRAERAGQRLWAVLVVGNLGTLLSPIAWPHHQLWAVVAAAYLVLRARRLAVVIGLLALLVALAFPLYLEADQASLWLRIGWDLPAGSIVLLCLAPGGVGRPHGPVDS